MRPLLALLAVMALGALAFAGDPAYTFVPGTELHFAGKGESFGQTVESTCRVWVVRRNADGTFRLVLCLEPPSGAPLWSWCDMAPDGGFAPNETTVGADPVDVLPPLPRPGEATRRVGPATYRNVPEDGGFACTIESGLNRVFEIEESYRWRLDDGLPAAVEKTVGRAGSASGRGTMRLAKRVERDAEWMERFATETDAYFEALRRYAETCDRALLDGMLERATIEEIRAELRARLADHAERAAFEKERKEKHGKLIGKPSPAWSANDLDGKAHALADYRGKVVVLDFWFRRCGWCVLSMPDVKEIATTYRDRPVAVVGMNVDRNDSDARFVVDALGLPYPSLKAREVRDLYSVMGYPTVVVIDTKGVVRRIHHGAWPGLRVELAALIDELLAEAE